MLIIMDQVPSRRLQRMTPARRVLGPLVEAVTAPHVVVLTVAFGLLALLVAVAAGPLWLDILAYSQLTRFPRAAAVAAVVEKVGQRGLMTAVLLVVAIAAARRLRSWGPLWLAVLTPLALTAGVGATKLLVGRPFPADGGPADPLSGHLAFPSGHSAGAVVFWMVIAALLAAAWPHATSLVGVLPPLMAGVVVLSSLLRGTHWLSDLVAGVLIGAVLASLLLHLARSLEWLSGRGHEASQGEPHDGDVPDDERQGSADARPGPAAAAPRLDTVDDLQADGSESHRPRPATVLGVHLGDPEGQPDASPYADDPRGVPDERLVGFEPLDAEHVG